MGIDRVARAREFRKYRTALSKAQCNKAKLMVEDEQKRDRIVETIQILALGGGALIALIVLAWLLTSGKMPWN